MSHTILLIHGMFFDKSVMEILQKHLQSAGHTCRSLSLPHHEGPASEETLGSLTTEQCRDWVEKYILDNGLEDAVLIGWSYGGLIAQQLASLGYGKALILLAPVPPNGFLPSMGLLLKTWNLWGRWKWWKKTFIPTDKQVHQFITNNVKPENLAAEHRLVRRESGRAIAEVLASPFLKFRHESPLAVNSEKLRGWPILIIAGKKDNLIPFSCMARLQRLYPSAQFHAFPNMGHYLPREPGVTNVARCMLDFLFALK